MFIYFSCLPIAKHQQLNKTIFSKNHATKSVTLYTLPIGGTDTTPAKTNLVSFVGTVSLSNFTTALFVVIILLFREKRRKRRKFRNNRFIDYIF
jgi:hypothetical protein